MIFLIFFLFLLCPEGALFSCLWYVLSRVRTSADYLWGGIVLFLCFLLLDLLKNKSRPQEAADGAAAWVIAEREMKERLKKEREARELKEKLEVSGFPIKPHSWFF